MRVGRLLGVFAVLVMVSAGALSAQPAGAAGQVSTASGTTIGPVQISALGHPRLCWEAPGNGSAVTLEHCDRMLRGQRWSLTPDGVLMNGNGYCLEAVPGGPLLVDFAGHLLASARASTGACVPPATFFGRQGHTGSIPESGESSLSPHMPHRSLAFCPSRVSFGVDVPLGS